MNTREKGKRLVETLADAEYRHLYVSDQIRELLPMQVKMLREERGWTQAELAERAGMAQVRISLLEDPDSSGMTLKTLKRLAQAFDVALVVRFAPFSELAEWASEVSAESLAPKGFREDAETHQEGHVKPVPSGRAAPVENNGRGNGNPRRRKTAQTVHRG